MGIMQVKSVVGVNKVMYGSISFIGQLETSGGMNFINCSKIMIKSRWQFFMMEFMHKDCNI